MIQAWFQAMMAGGGGGLTVSSVESVAAFTVHNSTLWEDVWAQLPGTLDVTLSDASVVSRTINWNQGSYVKETEGAVVVYGDIVLGGETNPSNVQASCSVTVDVAYVLRLRFWKLATMLQESIIGTPETAVTTNGDVIGTMYDYGRAAFVLGTSSNVNKPTIGSDAVMANYFAFTGSAILLTSAELYMRKFHSEASPLFSVQLAAKFPTNGTQYNVFQTSPITSTVASAGIHLRRTTGNKLQLFIYKKVSGQNISNYTTTATINAASDWVMIQIVINGTGATAGTIYMKDQNGLDTSESFTVNAGNDVSADGNFAIGLTSGLQIGAEFRVYNRVLTAGEITAWKTFNPARNTDEDWIRSNDLNPDDAGTIFSDAGGTVPSGDNDEILYSRPNITTLFGDMQKSWTATTGLAPLFKTGTNNYAYWDDAAIDQLTINRGLAPENYGKRVTFIVDINNDQSFGSHILRDGSRYVVQTGENYISGTPPDGPYSVIHADTSFTIAVQNANYILESGSQKFLWIIERDKNSAWRNIGKGVGDFPSPVTMSDPFNPNVIGGDAFGSPNVWAMSGNIFRICAYHGKMTDAIIERKRSWYRTYYNIT